MESINQINISLFIFWAIVYGVYTFISFVDLVVVAVFTLFYFMYGFTVAVKESDSKTGFLLFIMYIVYGMPVATVGYILGELLGWENESKNKVGLFG